MVFKPTWFFFSLFIYTLRYRLSSPHLTFAEGERSGRCGKEPNLWQAGFYISINLFRIGNGESIAALDGIGSWKMGKEKPNKNLGMKEMGYDLSTGNRKLMHQEGTNQDCPTWMTNDAVLFICHPGHPVLEFWHTLLLSDLLYHFYNG